MTTDELERLLAEQPMSLLHRLAQGRVRRHFRLGKRHLIDALLRHASVNRAGLESDLQALMQGETTAGHRRKSGPPARHQGRPHQAERHPAKSSESEPAEPATDLTALLEGIGVPPPQPLGPDPGPGKAPSQLTTADATVRHPTGGGTPSGATA